MAAPASVVVLGGEPVVVMTGPVRGGYIQNPTGAGEVLLVDMVNTPGWDHPTTFRLAAGETFTVPFLQPGIQIKATAETSGHKFVAVIW